MRRMGEEDGWVRGWVGEEDGWVRGWVGEGMGG